MAGCSRRPVAQQATGVAEPPLAPVAAPVPPEPPRAAAEPYLLHVPGISGESWVDHTMIRGLQQGLLQAGIHADIQIYDWTEHDPGIPALQALTRNRNEAKRIA